MSYKERFFTILTPRLILSIKCIVLDRAVGLSPHVGQKGLATYSQIVSSFNLIFLSSFLGLTQPILSCCE